jgi:hypothetical protein
MAEDHQQDEPVVVRDNRRLDPETGEVRGAPAAEPAPAGPTVGGPNDGAAEADLDAAQSLAAQRLDELQRLNAEYANYRKRVERDRDVAKNTALAGVAESLLPVLDDVHLARQHGDLTGPFVAIADKLRGGRGTVRPGRPRGAHAQPLRRVRGRDVRPDPPAGVPVRGTGAASGPRRGGRPAGMNSTRSEEGGRS